MLTQVRGVESPRRRDEVKLKASWRAESSRAGRVWRQPCQPAQNVDDSCLLESANATCKVEAVLLLPV